MKIALKIITPIKTVLSEEIDQLTLPTATGEIGILPNHANLFTKITPGEMTIKNNGKEQIFAVTGGFLQVSKNEATILADYVVRAQDIEVAKVKEARERAEKAIRENKGGKEFAVAQAELRKSLLELKVATKHRKI